MKGVSRLVHSSIGRKALMALTGLLLTGFLIAHASGNMLIFSGRDAINDYAQWLAEHPPVLWGARIGLIVVFVSHILLGLKLTRENRNARPVGYSSESTVQATFPSRSMLLTGALVFAYAVYHILHFTLGVVQHEHFELHQDGRHDVYNMVVHGFQNPLVSLSYVVALLILGLHLSHGIQSFFQTIGFNHPRYTPVIRRVGRAVAVLLVLAYMTIPLSILFGLVGAES